MVSCEALLPMLVRRSRWRGGDERTGEASTGDWYGIEVVFATGGDSHALMSALESWKYTIKARAESRVMANEVVITAKMARGMDTSSSTKGVTAYIGFHMFTAMLYPPIRTNIVACREFMVLIS